MPKETFFNLPSEKRQSIIDLAIEEFAENDYKNASISRIVARAGIAKGSFYQYFADTKDLYLYLIELSVQEKATFLSQMPPPETENIFDQLRWLLDIGLNFEFSTPQLARIGYRAVYDDAPLPDETREAIQSGSLAYFRGLVAQGIASGDISPDLDPEVAAFFFNTVFMNLGDYILTRQEIQPEKLLTEGAGVMDSPESSTIMNQVLTILERGLSPSGENGENQ
jgi:AcrR family transcriptional regulator